MVDRILVPLMPWALSCLILSAPELASRIRGMRDASHVAVCDVSVYQDMVYVTDLRITDDGRKALVRHLPSCG